MELPFSNHLYIMKAIMAKQLVTFPVDSFFKNCLTDLLAWLR